MLSSPEPIWCGETAHILASGPSMSIDIACRLRGERTITVNSTACIAIDAGLDRDGILYFMDSGWARQHWHVIRAWRGVVATTAKAPCDEKPGLLRFVQMERRPDFPAPGSPVIRWGRSSGHVAVSLAVALGAARIVLHGFDMRVVGDRSHHHDDYRRVAPEVIYANFTREFAGWHDGARRVGCEIVNATAGSALGEFPMVESW